METRFQTNRRLAHVRQLRQRIEKGWTPELQAEFQRLLPVYASDDKNLSTLASVRLHELSGKGCYREPEAQAFYSTGCCFWADASEHLGAHPTGLPCCPWCGAVLMQAPLFDFIQNTQTVDPASYAGTIDNFWKSLNAPCHTAFKDYV